MPTTAGIIISWPTQPPPEITPKTHRTSPSTLQTSNVLQPLQQLFPTTEHATLNSSGGMQPPSPFAHSPYSFTPKPSHSHEKHSHSLTGHSPAAARLPAVPPPTFPTTPSNFLFPQPSRTLPVHQPSFIQPPWQTHNQSPIPGPSTEAPSPSLQVFTSTPPLRPTLQKPICQTNSLPRKCHSTAAKTLVRSRPNSLTITNPFRLQDDNYWTLKVDGTSHTRPQSAPPTTSAKRIPGSEHSCDATHWSHRFKDLLNTTTPVLFVCKPSDLFSGKQSTKRLWPEDTSHCSEKEADCARYQLSVHWGPCT